MSKGISTGVHFGLTSGVITTLGLMVGLHAGTHSTAAVLGGIVTIAIADSFSDALGIHISKEAENSFSSRELWQATLATMFTKMGMASSFVVPVLLFSLNTAIVMCVLWGTLVLTVLSYRLARARNESPIPVICEHLLIALVVVFITHFAGDWVAKVFV